MARCLGGSFRRSSGALHTRQRYARRPAGQSNKAHVASGRRSNRLCQLPTESSRANKTISPSLAAIQSLAIYKTIPETEAAWSCDIGLIGLKQAGGRNGYMRIHDSLEQ